MAERYSVEVCRQLQEGFGALGLHRPMRIARHEPGTELNLRVSGVENGAPANIRAIVENFVGGGFAGQVYRIKLLDVNPPDSVSGLRVGCSYAIKILVPPSGAKKLFRDLLYWVGFQGPFQLQVNPAALKAAALWQKFIRRAAKVTFGDERAVCDIYATFVDDAIGSCGEISEWIEGRTWRLEVDDRLDLLNQYLRGKSVDEGRLGSAEYRAKRQFMADFVRMLHDLGAHELARQYEWWTCKSQPNCLKRMDASSDPAAGLTAVDFRAGLALLPLLPMSPVDFVLIFCGLFRGSIVQFDRGDIGKLERFINARAAEFADMRPLLAQLKTQERLYRDSLPDLTHNHVRLLSSARLWSTMFDSAAAGWRVRNLVNDDWEAKLRKSKLVTFMFFVVGLLPLLGRVIRRIWARPDWRRHYAAMVTSPGYLGCAIKGVIIEKTIAWHRRGRIGAQRARTLAGSPLLFMIHLPFSLLPPGIHRFLTDAGFMLDKLHYLFVRPLKLYFNRELREQWMRDMVADGQSKHMLTDEDTQIILSRLSEPYIQRYLISLVAHLLTLPLTQIVSFTLAAIYFARTGDELGAGGIVVLFQVVPISPGSFARGLWAVGIACYDRNFRDYNIAVFMSFFKYIGYLAFPIQMTYRYPVISRFMAAHWATEAVHVVPVFGERGALLEHWVFRLFYNWPLTIRRRMRRRADIRAAQKPRYWHVAACAIAAAALFAFVDRYWLTYYGTMPALRDVNWLAVLVPIGSGWVITRAAGGLRLWKRVVAAVVWGIASAALTGIHLALKPAGISVAVGTILSGCIWRAFAFVVLAVLAMLVAELKLPDPDLKK